MAFTGEGALPSQNPCNFWAVLMGFTSLSGLVRSLSLDLGIWGKDWLYLPFSSKFLGSFYFYSRHHPGLWRELLSRVHEAFLSPL